MAKQYKHNEINYSFQPKARKWVFNAPNYCLIQSCNGGAEIAHKVVRLIEGGLKRTKGVGLDNLARHHISAATGF